MRACGFAMTHPAIRRRRAIAMTGSLLASPALAQQPVQAPAGAALRPLPGWDVARLNRILEVDTPAFAGVAVPYAPARNAVEMFRLTYPSVVPEQGNRPVMLTGLLALPAGASGPLPLLSYQHGTVYGRQQVPSFPENSPETQLAIAQFAGQGYAVVGADYIGMGESTEPRGYMVKASHQQATADMIAAARSAMRARGVTDSHLFLGGWSQGGYVTMALMERLEQTGVAVRAAATASAPADPWATLNGFLNFPRPNDAAWVGTLFILASFSYEAYYGVPGLARSVIRPEHHDICQAAWRGEAVDAASIPTVLRDLVAAPYFDSRFFAESAFGRLLFANQAYRWVIRTPLRNHYGVADEVISEGIGRLVMTFQQAMGNTAVEAVSTGATSHRGTFARAVPQWKSWFDTLAAG